MPTLEEARELAALRRKDISDRRDAIVVRNAALRAQVRQEALAASTPAEIVPPDDTPETTLAEVEEEPVGPPMDPDLEETMARNPALAAMIMASNPGVKLPGLTAPPRPTRDGTAKSRAHYLDGKMDVGLLQQVDSAFREGGVFAPAPSAHVGGIGGGMAGIGSAPQEGTAFRSIEVQHLVSAMQSLETAPRTETPRTLQQSSSEVAHLVRSMRDAEQDPLEADGLTVLASSVNLRELLALAHLGVSQSRIVGGLTFRRLDVATFAILGEAPPQSVPDIPSKNGCRDVEAIEASP
jgi:hypothetical protein